MAKSRVDALLLARGLFETREKARAAILAGSVYSGDRQLTKPGLLIAETAEMRVVSRARFVSRGGEKLEHALTEFGINVEGATAADLGASTGGFTDCLLQHGARHVYAVDVGYGQLDYGLRQDARVTVMERTNARYLRSLPEPVDMATIDVSFISLTKVLGPLRRLLKPEARVIALIKPQFEALRKEVGRGGVVRDEQARARVIGRVVAWAGAHGYRLKGLTTSPLRGPAGNVEYLMYLQWPADAAAQLAAEPRDETA